MTFQHRAGVTPYTSSCDFAESCVLVKQSLGPLHCGSLLQEHSLSLTYGVILPSSLATVLSLTSGSSPCPPVSVLVRAAMESTLETFPGSWPHVLRYLSVDVPLPVTFYIPTTHFTAVLLFASPTIHSVGHTSLLRHSFTSIAGTGISACFPSTTPFGLALGPDLPRADEPSPGTLGLSVCRILTYISLLTPAFSLPYTPSVLTI